MKKSKHSGSIDDKKHKPIVNCIPIIISILALGFSVITFFSERNTKYKISTVTYFPQLTVKQCTLTNLEIKSSPPIINRNDLDQDTILKKVGGVFQANFQVEMQNNGNNNAQLLFIAVADTTSGLDYFRQLLFHKGLDQLLRHGEKDISYYSDIKISPNKEFNINVSRSIQFINQDSYTLHFWIVYRNEFGLIYDTYYWYRGIISLPVIVSYIDESTGQLINSHLESPEKIISFIDDNNSFKIYSKKESHQIKKILKHKRE